MRAVLRTLSGSATALCLAVTAYAQAPEISVDDAAVTEGPAGTAAMTFNVTLTGEEGEEGWVETFDGSVLQPLSSYDPRWTPILGELYVDPSKGAAIPNPNGTPGDDYELRQSDAPVGSVEITLDFYWDGHGAVGIAGAVQAGFPHRFYEAALWQHRIDILYIYGPSGGDWTTLAQSNYNVNLTAGFYRMIFVMSRGGASWSMTASVHDPANGFAEIERVSVSDGQLGEGTQGIGIYSDGTRGSYVTEMRVDPLVSVAATGHPSP